MIQQFKTRVLFAVLISVLQVPHLNAACPICCIGASVPFRKEMKSYDAIVVARAVRPLETVFLSANDEQAGKARFEIVHVLKGSYLLMRPQVIVSTYFDQPTADDRFLIMGHDPAKMKWSSALRMSPHGIEYIRKILKMTENGAERFGFFLDYLENKDEIVTRDAYDELAKASYADVKALREEMDHDKLVAWINDPKTPANRRRLYLKMLGICGSEKDIPILEALFKSADRKKKTGLDEMIASYLLLRGAAGVTVIEDHFLKNKKAEYADTYAAIMALRYHVARNGEIPRERILEALRHMLKRPDLADIVIPDLARWEDWSVIPTLVKLYQEGDKKSWVRVPVINYLRMCPLPESDGLIDELKKTDPEAVRRSFALFSLDS